MYKPDRSHKCANFLVHCVTIAALCTCVFGTSTAGWAREKTGMEDPYRFFTVRRVLGTVLVVGGGLLAQEGFRYKDQADLYYDRYQQADELQEANRFYRLTADRDVKSHVSWALSAALATGGLRLLFSNSPKTHEGRHENTVRSLQGLLLEPRVGQWGNSLILHTSWGFR